MANNIVKPLVSVIMPAYNAEAYITASIESVLNQTFTDFELIVVDDGSVDDTAKKVVAYADGRVHLIQQSNAGVAAARNKAVEKSQGRYIAFLDSDDLSLPERLEKQRAFLDAHPEIGLVGTAAEIWENNSATGRFYRHPSSPPELAFSMLFENFLVNSSVMLRRDVIQTVGPFTELESRRHEDYELWSRIGRRYPMANLPEVLVIYRVHPGSICDTSNFDANGVMLASENIAHASGSLWVRSTHRVLAALMRGQNPAVHGIKYEALQKLLTRLAKRMEKRFSLLPGSLDDVLSRYRQNLRHHWERCYGPLPDPVPSIKTRVARKLR